MNNDSKSPLISTIIPLYNGEKYIKETLQSVLNQTYQNFEIIIVDDCSTDASSKIVKEFDDSRIKYFFNEQNLGLNKNLEKGISLASGEYITLLGQDDMYTSDKFEKQLEYILSNNLDACYSSNYTYYSEDKIISNDLSKFAQKVAEKDKTLMDNIYIPDYDVILPMSQSAIFKTSVLKELNYLRKDIRLDDWPILVKVFENYNVGFFDEPTFYWRQHDNNMHSNVWYNLLISLEAIITVVPESKRLKCLANHLNFLVNQLEIDYFTKFRLCLASFILNPNKSKYKELKWFYKKSIKCYLKNIIKGYR